LQLDKTRIAIRERTYVDIVDLALRVVREFAGPLLLALCAGIAPVIALNRWLLAGIFEADLSLEFPIRYLLVMLLLVAWEIPLATAPLTLYLGQAVFTERPSARQIAREFFGSLGQLVVFQVLFRPFFLHWPYLNEVILLERNPMQAAGPNRRTTLSRSSELHRSGGSDVMVRALGSFVIGLALFAALWFSMTLLWGMLVNDWGLDSPMFAVWGEVTIWLVVGFLAVVRFLCYLDLRIRREGWEVEIAMRAEQARLLRHMR
jgi:hypothetical protein